MANEGDVKEGGDREVRAHGLRCEKADARSCAKSFGEPAVGALSSRRGGSYATARCSAAEQLPQAAPSKRAAAC